MKKILLIIILSLFIVNVNAQEEQTLGPDLIIDSLNIEPFPAQPGQTLDLEIAVRNSNVKKVINGLEFTVQESFPFSIEGDKLLKYENLFPNERLNLKFKIRTASNAISGANELKIDYQESGGINYVSSPINIDVKGTARDPSIVSIETNPSVIKPGDEVEIVITLRNTVPVLMKNIDINFDLSEEDSPFTPVGTTTKRSLTSLNKGNSKDLIFNVVVDADAEPKVYKVPLIVDYKDEFGNEYTIDTITGLKVSTDPEMVFIIDESEVKNKKGVGKVSVRVVNMGLSDVKFLSLKLKESTAYDIISVPQVYVGNLESDDYETADFQIYAKGSGNLPLVFDVSYRDSFNKNYEVEETIILPLYSKSELGKFGLGSGSRAGSFFTYIFLIVFVYLFVIEWKKVRNVPIALKLTVKHFLVFIKKIIKAIRLKTLFRAVNGVVKFFRE